MSLRNIISGHIRGVVTKPVKWRLFIHKYIYAVQFCKKQTFVLLLKSTFTAPKTEMWDNVSVIVFCLSSMVGVRLGNIF